MGDCKNVDKILYFYKLSPELVKNFQSQLLQLDSIAQEYPNLNIWLSKAKREDKKETQDIDIEEIENSSPTAKEKTKKTKLATKLFTRKGKKGTKAQNSPSPNHQSFKIIRNSPETTTPNSEILHERQKLDDQDYTIRKKLKSEGEGVLIEKSVNIVVQSIRAEPKLSFDKTEKIAQSDSSSDGFFLTQLLQS